jgi:hypothetical protein
MGIEFPQRRLIALVTRAERVGSKPYGRTSFEFDGIDAQTPIEDLDEAFSEPKYRKPFAAVRVVTTENRFQTLFKFVPAEGMWVELELEPHAGFERPLAFHSQLEEDGYNRHSVGRLRDARRLSFDGEPPIAPVPMGAAASAAATLAHSLATKCAFPSSAIASAATVRRLIWPLTFTESILVRDVGQASFISFICGCCPNHVLGHFDAGWPISFNAHTARHSVPSITAAAPVILSHWDWDHLHCYYKCERLRASPWITPVQALGPGAFKIATTLHNNKLLFGCARTISVGPIDLVVCAGPHPMNDTGLALIIQLNSGKRALLVGDANYQAVGTPWTNAVYDLLVVTHHGAEFQGSPPIPSASQRPAVVSVGRGNVYRHPRTSSLKAHEGAMWKIQMTSNYGRRKRGDRILS